MITILLIGVIVFLNKIVDLNSGSLEFLNLVDIEITQISFIIGSIKFSPKLTRKAQEKIKKIYGKGHHPNRNITLRDVARFHERYKRNKISLKNKKKEVKLLKASNRRLRSQNKELKKKHRRMLIRKFLMNCQISIAMKLKIIYLLLKRILAIIKKLSKLLIIILH